MRREAVIAVNRFGLGAAPGELAAAASDPRGWLFEQIKSQPEQPAFAGLPPTSEALKEYPRWIASLRLARSEATMGADGQPRGIEQNFREFFGPGLMKEVGARLSASASTPSPFHERLALFWANHFTVSAEKPVIFALVGAFEREAIRPHVGGNFADLLMAATKHPAMILYLDNNLSVRPGFKAPAPANAPNAPRPNGVNENLAREILELHTLGVNGGYTQHDVTAFARALTGWTVGGPNNPGFTFLRNRHDAGPKTILGKAYAEEGIAQGEAVLRDLVAHPATATHVATKLARHFIADEPPPGAIERIANAFRQSGGHLPAVYAALLESPEAWTAPLAKLKSPIEYIVSCLRAIPGAREAKPEALFFTLREMGQRPFFAPSPQGWPDTAAAWAGADGLWKRIEWAGALAARAGSRIDPLALARETYGEALSEATQLAIARAETRQQGLALWLASPEFQRR